jgi:hypothetical protein
LAGRPDTTSAADTTKTLSIREPSLMGHVSVLRGPGVEALISR